MSDVMDRISHTRYVASDTTHIALVLTSYTHVICFTNFTTFTITGELDPREIRLHGLDRAAHQAINY